MWGGEGGQISLWRKRCHIQEEVWLSRVAFFKADSALPRKWGLQSSLSAKKVTPIPFVVTLCRVAYSSRCSVSPAMLLMAAEEQSCHFCGVQHLKVCVETRETEKDRSPTVHPDSLKFPSCPLSLSSSSSALVFQCFSIAFNSLEPRVLHLNQTCDKKHKKSHCEKVRK